MREIVSNTLALGGLACIAVGAGMLDVAAGFIVGGAAAVFVSWRLAGRS